MPKGIVFSAIMIQTFRLNVKIAKPTVSKAIITITRIIFLSIFPNFITIKEEITATAAITACIAPNQEAFNSISPWRTTV